MTGSLVAGETGSVQIDLGAGSATDAVDYDAFEQAIIDAAALNADVSYDSGSNVLTFASTSDGTFDFTVDAIDDSDVEGAETIVGSLSNASVSNGTATITVPSTTTNITEIDEVVTFALSVVSEDSLDDSATQQATITEENEGDDVATFTIMLTGAPLNLGNTASVNIAFTGSTVGADFVNSALVSLQAVANTTQGVTFDGTTLKFDSTFVGSSLSFEVEAFDDADDEGPEDLIATLSNADVDEGSASIVGGQDIATVDLNDGDAVTEFPGGLAYTVAGKGSTGATLYSIDLDSGVATELGQVVVDGEAKAVFYGLSLSPTTDTLFGFATQGNKQWIVEINPVNGEVIDFDNVSGSLSGSALSGAAFDSLGNFYLLQQGTVYAFNEGAGTLTAIFTISGGLQMDGFSIDPANGDFFFAINDGSFSDLYTLSSSGIPNTNIPVSLTYVGDITGDLPDGSTGNASIDSLSFDNYGNLWGADNQGDLVKINPDTAEVIGGTTLANNEVTGSGVYSLAISIVEDQTFVGGTENEILTGGSGSDILTGGGGQDIFVWTNDDDIDLYVNNNPNIPSDGIARDIVTDFNDSGVDTLDLSDLLVDEESNDLTDYLFVEEVGSDVVITVTPAGDVPDATSNQVITLENTALSDMGVTSYIDQTDLLNQLTAVNGPINVDS